MLLRRWDARSARVRGMSLERRGPATESTNRTPPFGQTLAAQVWVLPLFTCGYSAIEHANRVVSGF